MRKFFGVLFYRLAAMGFSGAELNTSVYSRTLRHRVSWPDIAVRPVEYYGQCGEDVIVLSLLRAEAVKRGVDLNGQRYLEIGGNHPFATSPTYLLHRRAGMTGVIVEANPRLLADLRKGRPSDHILHGAVQTEDVDTVTLTISKLSEISSLDKDYVSRWAEGTVGIDSRVEVPALRMNEIVLEHFQGTAPCFLSTDVEGLDMELLQDFDFETYRPWIVQTEPSEHFHPGETQRMVDHMRRADYDLIARTDVNLIFADNRADASLATG